VEYLTKLMQLSANGVERYRFVLPYLEDREPDLARDAYDEFAKAPYAVVRMLKSDLRHEEIVARIGDPDVPATRRRLYFVMLGIVGDENDLPLLEGLMQSADSEQRRGLDMIIFSYLSIRGDSGLPFIEERFLGNKDCDYSGAANARAGRIEAAVEGRGGSIAGGPRAAAVGGSGHSRFGAVGRLERDGRAPGAVQVGRSKIELGARTCSQLPPRLPIAAGEGIDCRV
jgi:hypothetical protein